MQGRSGAIPVGDKALCVDKSTTAVASVIELVVSSLSCFFFRLSFFRGLFPSFFCGKHRYIVGEALGEVESE
jgi:hypothetical protein